MNRYCNSKTFARKKFQGWMLTVFNPVQGAWSEGVECWECGLRIPFD